MAAILTFLGACGLLWLMVRTIKNQPDLFSKDKLSKSFSTIGVLALILIAVIGISVLLLR